MSLVSVTLTSVPTPTSATFSTPSTSGLTSFVLGREEGTERQNFLFVLENSKKGFPWVHTDTGAKIVDGPVKSKEFRVP